MSVKKMDEVPEKKTESKILVKMGKKEQGRCQKESVVLKNGQSTDNGKHVTVRVQRIRKIHIKQKLIFFLPWHHIMPGYWNGHFLQNIPHFSAY